MKQCLYLYLALLPQNHKLIHELAAVYTEAIADIKRTVLRVIEQPVSSWPNSSCSLGVYLSGHKECHLIHGFGLWVVLPSIFSL